MDEIEYVQYLRYVRYWQQHPPLHILAAAYMGIKPKEEGDMDDLLANAANFGLSRG